MRLVSSHLVLCESQSTDRICLVPFHLFLVEKSVSSSSKITCDGGKKTIKKEYINDDYCDCEDGTDEPGTSACANAKFYCKNTPHLPLTIPSQWVDDGHCGTFQIHSRVRVERLRAASPPSGLSSLHLPRSGASILVSRTLSTLY